MADGGDAAAPTPVVVMSPLGEATFENIPSMSTESCRLTAPGKLNHKWTLDLESGLPDVEGLTRAELKTGFRLFFLNKHDEALKFFETYEDIYLFALGKASILFIYSVMTFEDTDLANAISYVKEVEVWVNAKVKELSGGGWAPHVFSQEPLQSLEELNYRMMSAECTLLTSNMQLLRDSNYEKIKGALNIRSAFQKLKSIKAQQERHVADGRNMDQETESAVNFGFGVFNLVVSLLPPRVMALVAMLGFPNDREFGLSSLELALNQDGVRSPVAALSVLSHHVFLQGAFCHSELVYGEAASRILLTCLSNYPDGGIFLMFQGRQSRLEKQCNLAAEQFEQAWEVQKNWPPLVHVCAYELAFTCMFLGQWDRAIKNWAMLFRENSWSKSFYAYSLGVCQLASGATAAAERTFAQLPDLLGAAKKINGRPLPVDRYVKRKHADYIAKGVSTLVLPALELMYIWNGFPQMDKSLLTNCLGEVTAWKAANAESSSPDGLAVSSLLEGALLSQLGDHAKAEPLLASVDVIKKQIKSDTWTIAYARYELAMLWWREDKPATDRAIDQTKRAMGKKGDFNFDLQLDLRGHLAMYQFKQPPSAPGNGNPGVAAPTGKSGKPTKKKNKKKR